MEAEEGSARGAVLRDHVISLFSWIFGDHILLHC